MFNMIYPTYIIAYCIDNDTFFVTNQRNFFYQHNIEFKDETKAINFFEKSIPHFINVRNDLMKSAGQKSSNSIYLENTKKHYTE